MKVFALNPTKPVRAKGKKMAKKKAATRRRRRKAPARKTTTKAAAPKRRRRRRASASAKSTAPKRPRRASAPKRRRPKRRSNPSVKGFAKWSAMAGFGTLGLFAAGFGAGVAQMGASYLPGEIGGFLGTPLTGSADSSMAGGAWTPAQYIGAGVVAVYGDKLLPKKTKPAHVMAFRVGAGTVPMAKALYTEVFPRVIPGSIRDRIPGLGATVGYDNNGQAWLRQGSQYVAMQGMGSMLYEADHMNGMGELVPSGPYDAAGWLHSGAGDAGNIATSPDSPSDEGLAGF